MWFLGRLGFNLRQENKREKARYSVTLCATYWHYLLLVWLLLFALLLRT
jgi:cytochrome c oxidase subunit 3